MYCILVTGIPAAGKSTMAKVLSEKLRLPVISKDSIKELLFDNVGFQSRAEKVNLGIASMEIMYYAAGQLMKAGQPFILENNFESSEHGMKNLLEKYQYSALTITLTGDYKVIYQRFLERENSPDRHRGHVVNDCYPEKKENQLEAPKAKTISYENFVHGIERRGFDAFCVDGRQIKVDTTDFSKVNMEELFSQIAAWTGNAKKGFEKKLTNLGKVRKMDISFGYENQKFNYRACAMMISEHKILAMHDERSPYFYLPGGRVAIGETAEQAVVREVWEELGITPKIIRPLWLNQAFFKEDIDNMNYHELCIYFLMDFTETDLLTRGDVFTSKEGHRTHVFEWLAFERLKDEYFYPLFLKKDIFNLPDEFMIRTEIE